MSGFLYYISGISKVTRTEMTEYGLGYALDLKGEPLQAAMSPGPDRSAGVVFSIGGEKGKQAMPQEADNFTWMKSPASEYWVGYSKASPPKPEDLERNQIFKGHNVKLSDDNVWHIPVARMAGGDSSFPRKLSWDGKEWSQNIVVEQYKALFDEACMVWDKFCKAVSRKELAGGEPLTLTVECNLAVKALACNYRISPLEISFLELLDTLSMAESVKAAIDIYTLEAWGKKNSESEGQ